MKPITKHPLFSMADVLKKAFILNGFSITDDCCSPELISNDKIAQAMNLPEEYSLKSIMLEGGKYALRTELLVPVLSKMRGELPIRKIVCGKVYDAKDEKFPARLRIEGIFAEKNIVMKDFFVVVENIVKNVFGVGAKVELAAEMNDAYKIVVTKKCGCMFTFGYASKATWIAKALLGTECDDVTTWVICVDVDEAALTYFDIPSREALYDNRLSNIAKYEDNTPYVGDTFANKVGNILRDMGYDQYFGMKLYPDGIYKKMNMIQDSWDTNNVGVALVEPLDGNTGLPTVLTPAVEQAMADIYGEGADSARIFEIAHIFLPGKNGSAPVEKISISMGAYGDGMNSKILRDQAVSLIKGLGIKNLFFIPTNMAIAYDTKDTWLLFDEKMRYLEGNCGGISDKAEKNFGIGVHAYMLNLEIQVIEQLAEDDYYYIPGEFR